MTAVEPCSSVAPMWLAHDVYATNNTPAIYGEKYFSFTSPRGHRTLSSSPPSSAPAQQARLRNHLTQTQQGTQRNPYVMNVTSPHTASDTDSFTMNDNHWPLEHIDEIYMMSTTFSIPNPCLLYTSPSPRDLSTSRMPSSA